MKKQTANPGVILVRKKSSELGSRNDLKSEVGKRPSTSSGEAKAEKGKEKSECGMRKREKRIRKAECGMRKKSKVQRAGRMGLN